MEVSVSFTTRPLYPQGKTSLIGWVNPRTGLDAVVKPLLGTKRPIIRPVAKCYTTELSRLLTKAL
jgi:hypothetical protein